MAARRWRVVDSFRDCAIASQLSKTSGCGHKFLRCSTRLFTIQPHDAESPPAKHGPLPSFSPPLHQSRIATLQLLAAGVGGRLRGGKSFRACDEGACDALRMETCFHCDGIPSERVGLIPRSGIRARAVHETSFPTRSRQHCRTVMLLTENVNKLVI